MVTNTKTRRNTHITQHHTANARSPLRRIVVKSVALPSLRCTAPVGILRMLLLSIISKSSTTQSASPTLLSVREAKPSGPGYIRRSLALLCGACLVSGVPFSRPLFSMLPDCLVNVPKPNTLSLQLTHIGPLRHSKPDPSPLAPVGFAVGAIMRRRTPPDTTPPHSVTKSQTRLLSNHTTRT